MLNLPIKILETQRLAAEASTVTFSNIAALVALWDAVAHVTSRHLVLLYNAQSPDAVDSQYPSIQFNGDGGTNYDYQGIWGTDNSAGSAAGADFPDLDLAPFPGTNYANASGGGMVLIPHAFNTVNHKNLLSLGGAAEFQVHNIYGRWRSTAAITSILLTCSAGNYAVGSIFHLGVIDERYLVEEVDLAGGAGVPTFDNIPQGEGDLAVIGYCRSDRANIEDEVLHTIDDDAVAGNYPAQELVARGGVRTGAQPNQECAMVSGDTAPANTFGALVANYSQYTKSNQPHFLSLSGYHSTANLGEIRYMSGRRANIEPIFKLALEPNNGANFVAGSFFSLYRVPKRIIDRQELTAVAASVTFDNIPNDFDALILHVYTRSDDANLDDEIQVSINGDVTADNYDWQELTAAIAAVAAARNLTSRQLLYIPADTEGASEFGGGSVLIPAYTETDRHKHLLALHGQQENKVAITSYRWENTAAITSIALSLVSGGNFMAGSVFELEGVLAKAGLPAGVGMRLGV